jgi:hypothetical protein
MQNVVAADFDNDGHLEVFCHTSPGMNLLFQRTGTFTGQSGNIQGTFSQHSGNIQSTFREHSVNIQGTFSQHPGNI